MSDWNSEQYLKFKNERTQPALDLANRLRELSPAKAADVGCGPGNSTAALKSVFPDAEVIGIDNSPNMIGKAEKSHPELAFRLCDASSLEAGWDVIFSNACLQWIPHHGTLIPGLMEKLNEGGVLAVQIPMNGEEPLFRIIKEVAADPRWDFSGVCFETNETLEPEEYFDILSACSSDFQIWETVYCHRMPDHEALLEWVKGTRLRPYLDALDEAEGQVFLDEILTRAKAVYPVMKNGEVVLHFRRFFFTAVK